MVHLSRIRRLFRYSGRAIKWILHPDEVNFFRRQTKKTEWLGRFFSAKEAVFKSLGIQNFGAAGFRLVEIRFINSAIAEAVLYGHLKKAARGRVNKIYVANTKWNRHIISQAISLGR